MIFNRLLPAAGDDQDLVAARGHRLFHPILDNGLVNQWKHFLRLSFGCRQKTSAKTGGGEYSFADFHLLHRGGRGLVDDVDD